MSRDDTLAYFHCSHCNHTVPLDVTVMEEGVCARCGLRGHKGWEEACPLCTGLGVEGAHA